MGVVQYDILLCILVCFAKILDRWCGVLGTIHFVHTWKYLLPKMCHSISAIPKLRILMISIWHTPVNWFLANWRFLHGGEAGVCIVSWFLVICKFPCKVKGKCCMNIVLTYTLPRSVSFSVIKITARRAYWQTHKFYSILLVRASIQKYCSWKKALKLS